MPAMRKAFFTIICFCCCIAVHAQNKSYEYSDTSLNDQPAVVSETPVFEEDTTTVSNTGNTGDILSDTTLYVTRIELSRDSVSKWKADKRFAYMKNLDSLLI